MRSAAPHAGVLIGNKCDFREPSPDDASHGADGLRAEVTTDEGAAVAASLGLAYFETSAVRACSRSRTAHHATLCAGRLTGLCRHCLAVVHPQEAGKGVEAPFQHLAVAWAGAFSSEMARVA